MSGADLAREGIAALQRGDAAAARGLFGQAIDLGGASAALWLLQAQACRALGDAAAEEAALDRVLAAEPRNIAALLMKGDRHVRADDLRAAASFYRIALGAAANAGPLSSQMLNALRQAEAACVQAAAEFEHHMHARMAAAGFGPERRSKRVAEALDILAEKKQVYFQEPTSFFFPGLPQIQFYDRADFAWAEAVEAATGAIRDELRAILEQGGAFLPYIESEPGRPQMLHKLLGDPNWSAFHILRAGEPVAGNAERCPRTLVALGHAPIPEIRGRSPMALFSLLKPGTHIAAHNGMLNTRLICHLPLIVPPGCRFRVGNEMREWEEGKLLIFDDSIDHEAWNDGDATRVILLFEIWRPEIGEAERGALTAMFEAITDYTGPPEEH